MQDTQVMVLPSSFQPPNDDDDDDGVCLIQWSKSDIYFYLLYTMDCERVNLFRFPDNYVKHR